MIWNARIFSGWIPCFRSGIYSYNGQFIELFGRLVKDQCDTPERIQFTDEQIRTVYSMGLSLFNLPVGSGETSNNGVLPQNALLGPIQGWPGEL